MDAIAIILEAPERIALRTLALNPMTDGDVRVEVDWSGISSGTEKLLWTGRMPSFPGMGYPLVPGYESVGRIVDAGAAARSRIGERVFVPGANCYAEARGLFGGTARTVILPAARAIPIRESLGREASDRARRHRASRDRDRGCARARDRARVLGCLIARIAVARGGDAPTVWETNAARRDGHGYRVIDPAGDDRRDYRVICDASGAADNPRSGVRPARQGWRADPRRVLRSPVVRLRGPRSCGRRGCA